ncbi:MAG: hypothetical protein AB7R89_11065 [Dehalococcoidia bacterium]
MSQTHIPQRIYVPLDADARERLARLARAERRHPSDQAALLIEVALRATPQTEGRIDVTD